MICNGYVKFITVVHQLVVLVAIHVMVARHLFIQPYAAGRDVIN